LQFVQPDVEVVGHDRPLTTAAPAVRESRWELEPAKPSARDDYEYDGEGPF
jgi:hypothetical protein